MVISYSQAMELVLEEFRKLVPNVVDGDQLRVRGPNGHLDFWVRTVADGYPGRLADADVPRYRFVLVSALDGHIIETGVAA